MSPFLIPIWLFSLILASFTAGIVGFAIWYFILRWRNRFVANLWREDKLIKTFRLKTSIETFKWGKNRYKVSFGGCRKNKRNVPILDYEIDNCELITFEKLTVKKSPKDLEIFMKSEGLDKLTKREAEKKIILIMVVAIVAVSVVAGVGFFFVSQANNNLTTIMRQFINQTKVTIK